MTEAVKRAWTQAINHTLPRFMLRCRHCGKLNLVRLLIGRVIAVRDDCTLEPVDCSALKADGWQPTSATQALADVLRLLEPQKNLTRWHIVHREMTREALYENGGNAAAAGRWLGVTGNSVLRWARRYNLTALLACNGNGGGAPGDNYLEQSRGNHRH